MKVAEALILVRDAQGTVAAAVRGEEVIVLGGSRSEGSYESQANKERYRDPTDDPTGECANSHAVLDLVLNAAMKGIALDGSTVVTYALSCVQCAKVLIGSGVRRVRTAVPISEPHVLRLLSEAALEHFT